MSPLGTEASPSDHLNVPAEAVDWRKAVEDLHKRLVSGAWELSRDVPPRSRKDLEKIADQGPAILNNILDLEKLQQDRLDEISQCHEKWQKALTDRTGELGDLDKKFAEVNDKVRQQRSDFDRQVQCMSQNETMLNLRQAEADRAFALTKANTTLAEENVSGLTREKDRLESLKKELDAKGRYQKSRTLDLSNSLAQLDKDVAETNFKQRNLARQQKEVDQQMENLDKWKAYKSAQVAKAEALSNQAARRNELLSSEMEGMREQKRHLEKGLDDTRGALQAATDSEQTLTQQLSESRKEICSLQNGLLHVSSVLLPQKESNIKQGDAELRLVKKDANEFVKESSGKISNLNAEILRLNGSIREQKALVSQLAQEKVSLQDEAARSQEEANSEIHLLANENIELQATVHKCELEHSDIDEVRRQLLVLQRQNDALKPRKIEEERAKRLQDTAIAEVAALRKERDGLGHRLNTFERERNEIEQDRNEVRQERDRFERRLSGLRDEATAKSESYETSLAEKDNRIEDLHASVNAAEQERDELNNECNRLFQENNRLKGDVTRLSEDIDILRETETSLHNTANDTNAQLARLTAQLESCHCREDTTSRKRSHRQMDSSTDQSSPTGQAGRMDRRFGKAPESRSALSETGPSNTEITTGSLPNPMNLGSRGEGLSILAGSSTDSSRQAMNIAAPRALGTANPTITPSNDATFILMTKDAKLLNFSSDVLSNEILQALRRRFPDWNSRPKFNWGKVQPHGAGRSCIEARFDKRKSLWNDGEGYACALCDHSRRLCMVAEDTEQLLLLPRKAAENEGKGPADTSYWMR